MKILHRHTQAELFSDDSPTMKITLEKANLRGAYLRGAYLGGAYLGGADLRGALCPTVLLLAQWGEVSDTLCLELMRYDSSNHPDPTAFDKWAADPNSKCPYSATNVIRCAHFQEKRELWSPGPSKSAYELMCMVLDEKCPTWREVSQ